MKTEGENSDISFLIILIALVCFGVLVFPATFVQDDWNHLYQIWGKNLSEIGKYFEIWNKNKLDSLNYFRPLSTKLYFYFMESFFGFNVKYYFWVNWGLFAINSYVASRILKKFVNNLEMSVFIFCFNLVWFTGFAYVSIAEVLIFTLLTLLTILSYINKRFLISILFFTGALMSRETAVVVPLVLLFYELLINKNVNISIKVKRGNLFKSFNVIFVLVFIDCIYLLFRLFSYGLPKKENVYDLWFGIIGIKNLLKYGQWSLNISGILFENKYLIILLGIFLFLNLIVFVKFLLKNESKNKFVLGFLWFVLFLLPVLFFENHIDPWNLMPAFLGFTLCLSSVWDKFWNTQILLSLLYLVLFFIGLFYYRKNHWVVVRQNIVLVNKDMILANCNNKIVFKDKLDSELDFAFYGTLGPKIMCDNRNLEVFYGK